MTDSELLDRVAAWLASRGLTPTPGEGLWDACSGSFGATSPPALGCLLAMVREAWACPGVYARESGKGGWVVCVRNLDPNGPVFAGPFRAPTEAEALVTALEAAPQPGTVTT